MNQRTVQWQQANQDHLMAVLEILRAKLESHLGVQHDAAMLLAKEEQARQALPAPSALQQLEALFRLTPFERETLLLCAAMEIMPAVSELYAALHKDPLAGYPTFGLAMAYLQEPAWGSITPEGPLRKFRLIEMQEGMSLTRDRLRMPERVLHYLCGTQYLEPSLTMVQRIAPDQPLVPSHAKIAARASQAIAESQGRMPVIQLIGEDGAAVAAKIAKNLNLDIHGVKAADIPAEINDFVAIWTREALLLSTGLLIEADHPEAAARVVSLATRAHFPLIVASEDKLDIPGGRIFEIAPAEPAEVADLWRDALGPAAEQLNGSLETLSKHFHMSPELIRTTADLALAVDGELDQALWAECRKQSRQRLDNLAQRIDSKSGWNDIVLPEAQMTTLRQIATHVKQRAKVYDTWGFAERTSRGLGISALFAGPSGTGKTLAAEVIAGALDLDLYRIDLSQVVSKYLGETEKNLRRIFQAAEGSGAVLLFDEADAIFGKRTEVKDSHDRYANIEVGYLLQRMEAYQGLVILTSNLKNSLDSAFMRRIRFVVHFPFPEFEDRQRIWERIFPAAMPREDIEVGRLAELSLAGGNIRNIAINAAFLAAGDGKAVGMDHLVRAARSEFAKLERTMGEFDMGGVR